MATGVTKSFSTTSSMLSMKAYGALLTALRKTVLAKNQSSSLKIKRDVTPLLMDDRILRDIGIGKHPLCYGVVYRKKMSD